MKSKAVVLTLALLLIAIATNSTLLPTRAQVLSQKQVIALVPLTDGTAFLVTWDASQLLLETTQSSGYGISGSGESTRLPRQPEQILVSACGKWLWIAAEETVRRIDLPAAALGCSTSQPTVYAPLIIK